MLSCMFIFNLFSFSFTYLAAVGLSCDMRDLQLRHMNSWGMWDLVPSPGIEPRPPALTGQSLSPQESPTFNLLWCYTVMGPYSSPWSPGEACQKTETWPQILSAALILILFLLKDSCILTLLYIKHPSCKVRLGSATTAAGYSLLGLQM